MFRPGVFDTFQPDGPFLHVNTDGTIAIVGYVNQQEAANGTTASAVTITVKAGLTYPFRVSRVLNTGSLTSVNDFTFCNSRK